MYVLTKLHIPIIYDLRKNKHKNKAKENNTWDFIALFIKKMKIREVLVKDEKRRGEKK